MRRFRIETESAGKRADVFLAEQYPRFSRASMEVLFDGGYVLIDGKPVKPSHKLKINQSMDVDESPLEVQPPPIVIPILYENDAVVVVNKPSGLLSHSKGALNAEPTVATFIKSRLTDPRLTGNRAGIVHRLDRATSGVMIAAKTTESLAHLQKQFAQRRTKKTYLSLVEGVAKPSAAIIDAPIGRNPKKPQTFRIDPAGKPAQTRYKVLSTHELDGQVLSLMELEPTTGRTHQLRVHLGYIGHPVAGDRTYGTAKEHMYLHASSLEITLPGGQRRVFKAPLPEYFKEVTG